MARVCIFLIIVALIGGNMGCAPAPTSKYDLTISSTEGGSVTSPGEPGPYIYDEGEVVNLIAETEKGYEFVNWTGDVDEITDVEDNTTTITMKNNYSITATFAVKQYSLIVISTEGGSVTTPGENAYTYDKGEVVNLAAVADEGYQLISWSGDVGTIADVNDATTTITMHGDYAIIANFELIPDSTPIAGPTIAIIVSAEIAHGVSESLGQFKVDLKADGYNIVEKIWSGGTPPQLRDYLADLHSNTTSDLVGAFLLGDLPKPYYRVYYPPYDVCPERGPYEFVSLEFYQDLDGYFDQVHVEEFRHSYTYDSHTGKIDNEIWVGVLPFVWDSSTTIAGINRYFAKNHWYRQGIGLPAKGYLDPVRGSKIDTPELYSYQIDLIINSSYGWGALIKRGNVGIFPDNSLNDTVKYPDARYAWEVAMLSNDYDFATFGFHGDGSIDIDADWVKSHRTTPTFMRDATCSYANIDYYDNLDTALLYADNNAVLVMGATGPQGGLGQNIDGDYRRNMAQDLAAGKSFGEAYLNHTNAEYVGCCKEQKEYFGAQFIFLGDPTLRLQEHMHFP
jgi:hypothetical protein